MVPCKCHNLRCLFKTRLKVACIETWHFEAVHGDKFREGVDKSLFTAPCWQRRSRRDNGLCESEDDGRGRRREDGRSATFMTSGRNSVGFQEGKFVANRTPLHVTQVEVVPSIAPLLTFSTDPINTFQGYDIFKRVWGGQVK